MGHSSLSLVFFKQFIKLQHQKNNYVGKYKELSAWSVVRWIEIPKEKKNNLNNKYKVKYVKDLEQSDIIFYPMKLHQPIGIILVLCPGMHAHAHRHIHRVASKVTPQRYKPTSRELTEDTLCSYFFFLNTISRLRHHCFQHVLVITSLCHSA